MSSVQNECVNRQAIIYVAEIAVRSRSYYARADLHVFRLASTIPNSAHGGGLVRGGAVEGQYWNCIHRSRSDAPDVLISS